MTSSSTVVNVSHIKRAMIYHVVLALVLAVGAVLGFLYGFEEVRSEVLIVLTFHGVTETPMRPWEIKWSELTGWLDNLKNYDFIPLEPASFSSWLSGGISGGRRFIVTFDDGLKSSVEAIMRLKKEYGISSVFFVVTDLIGKPGYVEWEDLRALASSADCLIGLHGLRHVEPPKIIQNGGDFYAELIAAKNELEKRLGMPVTWYAYPFGEYDTASRNCVASAGFAYGFTIDGEAVSRTADRFLLPRVMYLKGVEQAGGPSIADWTPPRKASMGSLHITLAAFVGLMAIRSILRFIMLRRLLLQNGPVNANA